MQLPLDFLQLMSYIVVIETETSPGFRLKEQKPQLRPVRQAQRAPQKLRSEKREKETSFARPPSNRRPTWAMIFRFPTQNQEHARNAKAPAFMAGALPSTAKCSTPEHAFHAEAPGSRMRRKSSGTSTITNTRSSRLAYDGRNRRFR